MFKPETIRSTVVGIVDILASEFDDQLQYLNSEPNLPFTMPVDEIAHEFDHCVEVVLGNAELRTQFTDREISELRIVDELLERISGPANFRHWSLEALKNSEEWQLIRNRSKGIFV